MKELAAEADQRWNSKESFLDAPQRQQPEPAIGVRDPGGYAPMTEPEDKQGVINAVEEPEKVGRAIEGEKVDEGRFRGETTEQPRGKKVGDAPWASQLPKGSPGEDWQPSSWTPGAATRR
jgi:NADH dehydrogenase [ubiquinone] 1 alpha subcomplex assembly factor 2